MMFCCHPTNVNSAGGSHTTSTSLTIASLTSSALTTNTVSVESPQLPTPIFRIPSLRPASTVVVSTSHGTPFSDSTLYPPTHSLANHTPTMPLENISKLKLLTLSLKRFNGDKTQWSTFWDFIQLSIDSNHGLLNFDKN